MMLQVDANLRSSCLPILTLEWHSRDPLRPVRALVVVDCALGLCAVRLIRRARINRHRLALLRTAVDVLVVPDLAQHRVAVVGGALARIRGVEPRARAADERDAAVLLG